MPMKAWSPMRQNWCTPAKPLRMTWSPTTTCPARVALLENTQWLPTWQSCATWVYASSQLSLPIRVTPPPSPVPRWSVVNSRMTLRSPISSETGSPRNFLSCGSPPRAAWPWTWLPRPSRVGPGRRRCRPGRGPPPISTPAPTTVKAPMLTPSPMRAPGSTIALGWIDAVAISGRDLRAEDLGAGDLLAVDAGHAGIEGHVADLALDRDLDVQAVAGHHHVREPGVVHLDQVRQPALVAGTAARELGEHAAGLGHGLDHQHAGHDRAVGEVALEIGLVGGHV